MYSPSTQGLFCLIQHFYFLGERPKLLSCKVAWVYQLLCLSLTVLHQYKHWIVNSNLVADVLGMNLHFYIYLILVFFHDESKYHYVLQRCLKYHEFLVLKCLIRQHHLWKQICPKLNKSMYKLGQDLLVAQMQLGKALRCCVSLFALIQLLRLFFFEHFYHHDILQILEDKA